jgi:hypothetical protein
VRRQPRRHQARNSAPLGWPASGSQRSTNGYAAKTNSSSPAENFESKARMSASAKKRIARGDWSRHRVAKLQSATIENSATAVSVSTSGPNVRNVGMVANQHSANAPPQPPASRSP